MAVLGQFGAGLGRLWARLGTILGDFGVILVHSWEAWCSILNAEHIFKRIFLKCGLSAIAPVLERSWGPSWPLWHHSESRNGGENYFENSKKRSNLRPCIEAGSRKHFWMAYTEMGGDWTGAVLGTFSPGGRPRARVLDTVERLSQDLTCTCPKGRRSLHIRQPCSEIPQTILMCALFKGRGVSAAEPNADC